LALSSAVSKNIVILHFIFRKTIVPPEPTGEGLSSHVVRGASLESDLSTAASMTEDSTADDGSVHSARSTSTAGSSRRSQPTTPSRHQHKKSAVQDLLEHKKKSTPTYTYATFPSKLDPDLFGTPRPLPAAVIAEFDRQRKDAAQFRRKAPRKPKDSKQHIHRAHSTVDPVVPPSPEVATFTVFFMAFTGLVGKELMELSVNQLQDRTILSNYVPTTAYESDDEGYSDMDDTSQANGTAEKFEDAIDELEKEGVAAMKTSRPAMRGMFGDDEEEPVQPINGETQPEPLKKPEEVSSEAVDGAQSVGSEKSGKASESAKDAASTDGDDVSAFLSVRSEGSRPRERFRDKLSDLQIEEAKAKGRAQLGLAFEMLTMMKKRALKADPDAYQCLIDACGRVGDTKRATELLAKMHEDGIVADGTVYACLVSAFSAERAWKDDDKEEDLPEWANSTAVDMDWNKLQKRSFLDRVIGSVVDLDDEEDEENEETSAYQKLRKRLAHRRDPSKGIGMKEERGTEFFVTETVERQIALGENLLEIVFPDISIDTENEICPRCNFTLSDDDVVNGWTPGHLNDYTTACPNCTQRFVPHFCVQCSSPSFVGSKGPESPLMCERLSPWVLQKEIRSVMSDEEGTANLLSPEWREKEYKNAVLWWNLVLSCMRYRFPFTFLLQGNFEQNLIGPMPED
jgi:pentatricopeptide repeat protein